MTQIDFSEEEIHMAMKVHDCSREEAISTFCDMIRNYRRIQKEEYNKNLYKEKRAAEYPNFSDYLDGIVKGDQEQINKYIADCLAIKQKYPKE